MAVPTNGGARWQAHDSSRLTNRVDAVGTTRYTYAHGLLTTEDGPWANNTVAWDYHNARIRSALRLQQTSTSWWTNSYAWDASRRLSTFGRLLGSSGTLAVANRMRFSSKPWMAPEADDTAGMYYYGYRFYDPLTQRWANRDPLGESGSPTGTKRIKMIADMPWEGWYGPNLYEFCRNSPIRYVDVDGRFTIPLPGLSDEVIEIRDPLSCGNRIKNEVWEQFAPGGQVPANDPNFHYGHCVAHCRLQRECPGGRFTSWAGGLGKEILDENKQHWHKEGPGYDGGDMDANREGRKRGRHCKEKSCEEACKGTEG